MFSCLSSCAPLLSKNPIPFRVRDVEGNRRYGIATTSVADLQRKVRKKFGVRQVPHITLTKTCLDSSKSLVL